MSNPLDNSQIIDSMLNSDSPDAKAAIIAFARHLSTFPLSTANMVTFTKIISKNYSEAADIFFTRRTPDSFFSTLPQTAELIIFALSTLSNYRYSELYSPITLSCLGILVNNYRNPSKDQNIYSLKTSDIYHIAKYLQKKEKNIESLILDLLENIGSLPSSAGEISKVARNILNNWFDNSKRLDQVIPFTILK